MRVTAAFLVGVLTLLPPTVHEVTAQDFSAVVPKIRSSVALILVEQNDGSVASGTGFSISGQSVLVTAAHVVSDVKELAVKYEDGTVTAAKPSFVWQETDIALVRPAKVLSVGLSGRTSPPRVGEPVIVVGYPLASKLGVSQVSVTQGIVSAVHSDVIQLNISVNPGNSGGPVLDATGTVIGVVSGRLPDTGLAFASPWRNVKSSIDALAKDSYPVAIGLGDSDKSVTGWIEQGTILVQIDALAKFLGGIVFWDGPSKTLTLAVAGKRMMFVENSRYMDVDGQQFVLPLPVRADRRIPLKPVITVLGGSLELELARFTARVQLPGPQTVTPSQPAPEVPPSATPTPAPPPISAPTRPTLPDGARSWIALPGVGIGPVALGRSRARVEELLGDPDETRSIERILLAFYRRFGLTVWYETSSMQVVTVSVSKGSMSGVSPTSDPEVLHDLFVSSYQIRLGDARASVIDAHGSPLSDSTNDAGIEILTYQGISFGLGNGGQVLHISVFTPQSASRSLTGTFVGNYTATAQPGAVYQGVFQITQYGNTIIGSITTNTGRAGNIEGVVEGSRINATITFTDFCRGRASVVIDITDGGLKLVGNYTAMDCLGTYSGGFILIRQ